MAQPVVPFEISGADPATARSFYVRLFDWRITVREGQDCGLVAQTGEKIIGGGTDLRSGH